MKKPFVSSFQFSERNRTMKATLNPTDAPRPAPRVPLLALLIASLIFRPSSFTHAFPPAPPHTIHGMVRDEWGNPLAFQDAEIVMLTASGATLQTDVALQPDDGVNYTLKTPMDSGITYDAYKPTALKPYAQFLLKVKVGNQVFLPIEMNGVIGELGLPGKATRLDLTLGVDSDGDGLPDAWERALIQSLAGLNSLQDVDPNADSDKDGLSNLQEYLAGTYAFDPENGLSLEIVGFNEGRPLVDFTAIRGRSYEIQTSSDLKNWSTTVFTIPAEGEAAPLRDNYKSQDVRKVRVELHSEASGGAFFRLMTR